MATGKLHILVIEDELELQKLVRRRAERDGLDVTEALTSAQGFALATTTEPDLILLDLHLPDGTGLALLSRLRAHPRTADLPIVAWSGSDAVSGETEALRAGANAYVNKLDLGAVFERIRELIAPRWSAQVAGRARLGSPMVTISSAVRDHAECRLRRPGICARTAAKISMNALPSAAGLLRVDQLLGIHYYENLYSRTASVFGAMPSMHCAYPVLGLLTAWRAANWKTRPIHILYTVTMFVGSNYLDHHWVWDGVAGVALATAAVWLAGKLLRADTSTSTTVVRVPEAA